MKKLYANIILITVSSVLTLALAELAISRWLPQTTLSQLKANRPNCYASSDYLPFTLKPNCTTYHSSPEFSISIHINNLGYRGHNITIAKSPTTYRILIVGDSMTFGHGVEDNETFSALLENILNQSSPHKKIEVINAGFTGGFSPDSYYVFLNQELPRLRPDLVIFNLFTFNDVTDMEYHTMWTETDNLGLPLKISDKQRYVSKDGFLLESSQPWYYKFPLVSNSHSVILVGKTLSSLASKVSSHVWIVPANYKTALYYYQCLFSNQCFPEMENLFYKLSTVTTASFNITRRQRAKFVVVIIPADVQIDDSAWEKYQTGRFGLSDPPYPQTRFIEFLQAQHIPYVDLLPEFIRHKDKQLFYKADGHLNQAGHLLTAQTLANYLLKTGYR